MPTAAASQEGLAWTTHQASKILPMNDIVISVQQDVPVPGEVSPNRRAAVDELAGSLRENGPSVLIRVRERDAAEGSVPPETILFFIGSGVASGLLSAIATDIYNSAKSWAVKQFRQPKKPVKQFKRSKKAAIHVEDHTTKNDSLPFDPDRLRFVIRDPKGNVLLIWQQNNHGGDGVDFRERPEGKEFSWQE